MHMINLNSFTEVLSGNDAEDTFRTKDHQSTDEKADLVRSETISPINGIIKAKIRSPVYIDSGPPPYTEYARMARYIVHYSGILK